MGLAAIPIGVPGRFLHQRASRAPRAGSTIATMTAASSPSRGGLKSRLPRVPHDPGVYRFLGEGGEVLYVGKAKDLRKRVSSYFVQGRDSPRPHR